MTRACDLGPGDVWGSPSDDVDHCTECGAAEDFDVEFCQHAVCAGCECGDCLADADIAEREAEDARRERWAAMLEDKGDEMREAYR